MQHPPLVSILIPAYNQPRYIVQAVGSALAQDYPALEIVVSDDSTDNNTRNAILPLLSDKRLSYYHNTTRLGRVANYRKLLFELAKGEWVVMLDGDDYYTDNSYISSAIALVQSTKDIVLIGAEMKVINENTGEEQRYAFADTDLVIDGKELFSTYDKLPPHQTSLYPRELACALNFYRHASTASDSESLYRLCLHGKLGYMARPVAVWRVHETNTTFTRNIGKQVKELNFIDSVYADVKKSIAPATARAWRKRMYYGMCMHLINLSFSAGQYNYVRSIVFRFWRIIGWKSSIRILVRTMTEKPAPAQTGNTVLH